MANNFSQNIRLEGKGSAEIIFSGDITEQAELSFFIEDAEAEKVIVKKKDVVRINSLGVRTWIKAIKEVPSHVKLEFHECSIAIMDQVNMISNFLGEHEVRSFYCNYYCSDCDKSHLHLIDLNQCVNNGELVVPSCSCPECDEEMELNDDPDEIFSFLL